MTIAPAYAGGSAFRQVFNAPSLTHGHSWSGCLTPDTCSNRRWMNRHSHAGAHFQYAPCEREPISDIAELLPGGGGGAWGPLPSRRPTPDPVLPPGEPEATLAKERKLCCRRLFCGELERILQDNTYRPCGISSPRPGADGL